MLGDAIVVHLKRGGHAVDWVRDGADADAALRSNLFELVILDLGLPRQSGPRGAAQLRERGGVDAGADHHRCGCDRRPRRRARRRRRRLPGQAVRARRARGARARADPPQPRPRPQRPRARRARVRHRGALGQRRRRPARPVVARARDPRAPAAALGARDRQGAVRRSPVRLRRRRQRRTRSRSTCTGCAASSTRSASTCRPCAGWATSSRRPDAPGAAACSRCSNTWSGSSCRCSGSMLATITISEFLVESAIDAPYDEKLDRFRPHARERGARRTATGVSRASGRLADAALRSPRPDLLRACATPTSYVVAGEHADGVGSRCCCSTGLPMLHDGQVGDEPVRVATLQIPDPRDPARRLTVAGRGDAQQARGADRGDAHAGGRAAAGARARRRDPADRLRLHVRAAADAAAARR